MSPSSASIVPSRARRQEGHAWGVDARSDVRVRVHIRRWRLALASRHNNVVLTTADCLSGLTLPRIFPRCGVPSRRSCCSSVGTATAGDSRHHRRCRCPTSGLLCEIGSPFLTLPGARRRRVIPSPLRGLPAAAAAAASTAPLLLLLCRRRRRRLRPEGCPAFPLLQRVRTAIRHSASPSAPSLRRRPPYAGARAPLAPSHLAACPGWCSGWPQVRLHPEPGHDSPELFFVEHRSPLLLLQERLPCRDKGRRGAKGRRKWVRRSGRVVFRTSSGSEGGARGAGVSEFSPKSVIPGSRASSTASRVSLPGNSRPALAASPHGVHPSLPPPPRASSPSSLSSSSLSLAHSPLYGSGSGGPSRSSHPYPLPPISHVACISIPEKKGRNESLSRRLGVNQRTGRESSGAWVHGCTGARQAGCRRVHSQRAWAIITPRTFRKRPSSENSSAAHGGGGLDGSSIWEEYGTQIRFKWPLTLGAWVGWVGGWAGRVGFPRTNDRSSPAALRLSSSPSRSASSSLHPGNRACRRGTNGSQQRSAAGDQIGRQRRRPEAGCAGGEAAARRRRSRWALSLDTGTRE